MAGRSAPKQGKTKAQKRAARDKAIRRAMLKRDGLWRDRDPLTQSFAQRLDDPKA